MDEIVATLVVWVVGSSMTGLLLWLDRRRLDERARARGWNGVTTAVALSGLFVPAPLTLGAHVWVTRSSAWPVRLLLSLVGSALALLVTLLVSELVLRVIEAVAG